MIESCVINVLYGHVFLCVYTAVGGEGEKFAWASTKKASGQLIMMCLQNDMSRTWGGGERERLKTKLHFILLPSIPFFENSLSLTIFYSLFHNI